MDEISKSFLRDMMSSSFKSQKEMMDLWEAIKHTPQGKLCLAMFKDMIVYKEMINTEMMKTRQRLMDVTLELENIKREIKK